MRAKVYRKYAAICGAAIAVVAAIVIVKALLIIS
jgi:hypothetical protein